MLTPVASLAAALACVIAASAQPKQDDDPKLGGVAGTVVESKSGEPVRKALVLLRRDPNAATGTYTDDSGKFSFKNLEPGAYTFAVEKDGWVAARESRAVTATITAGQTSPAVTLKLLRTGTIAGRAVDSDGEPLAGVSVQVIPDPPRRGGQPGAWASTNDRGEYRAYNVAPGQYRICASYSSRSQRIDMQMQPAVALAYPRTCFPGTPQGSVYAIGAGAELNGIDFRMVPAHAVKVRGRVILQATERPLFAMVTLQPAGSANGGGPSPEALLREGNGNFELQGVLPGRYRLTVAGAGIAGDTKFGASKTIEVGSTDLDGIEIIAGPPRKIEGKLVVPEGRKPPPLIVFLNPRDPADHEAGGMAQVSAQGTFSFSSVGSSEYDVMLGSTGPGDDLYVSAIRLGERDALAEGVRSDVPGDLEIVMKPNGGSVTFSVVNDNDEPVPASHVVLLPDPPKERQLALMGDCRTGAQGGCTIQGIVPGDYHAYAFPAQMELDQRAQDAVKGFEQYGKAVTIAEGDRRTLQLKPLPVE